MIKNKDFVYLIFCLLRFILINFNFNLNKFRIDNNTDVALHNIEAGLGEIKKIDKDVRSNRGLLFKVFLDYLLFKI